jgi:hypothetical protein
VESKADRKSEACAHLTWPTPSCLPSPAVTGASSDTASRSRASSLWSSLRPLNYLLLNRHRIASDVFANLILKEIVNSV